MNRQARQLVTVIIFSLLTLTTFNCSNSMPASSLQSAEDKACTDAAYSQRDKAYGTAAGIFSSDTRYCYDVIDTGHYLPGSKCLTRVEAQHKQALADADLALSQALSACEAAN
jgi:hypothetical protein